MVVKPGPVAVSVVALIVGICGAIGAVIMMGFSASVDGSTPEAPATGLPAATSTLMWVTAFVFLVVFNVVNATACCRGDGSCGLSGGARLRNIMYIVLGALALVFVVAMNVHTLNKRDATSTCFQCPSCQSQGWSIGTFNDDLTCNNPPTDNPDCNCYSTALLGSYDACYCALTKAAQQQSGIKTETQCKGDDTGSFSCIAYKESSFYTSTRNAVVLSSIIGLISVVLIITGAIGTCNADEKLDPGLMHQGQPQTAIPVARAVQQPAQSIMPPHNAQGPGSAPYMYAPSGGGAAAVPAYPGGGGAQPQYPGGGAVMTVPPTAPPSADDPPTHADGKPQVKY